MLTHLTIDQKAKKHTAAFVCVIKMSAGLCAAAPCKVCSAAALGIGLASAAVCLKNDWLRNTNKHPKTRQWLINLTNSYDSCIHQHLQSQPLGDEEGLLQTGTRANQSLVTYGSSGGKPGKKNRVKGHDLYVNLRTGFHPIWNVSIAHKFGQLLV